MPFFDALAVSVLLCLATFGVGYLPLALAAAGSKSLAAERRGRWCLTLGVGILLGTAFVVILPEGIHTMYQPPRAARVLPSTSLTPTDGPHALDETDEHSAHSTERTLPYTRSVKPSGWSNSLSVLVPKSTEEDDWQHSMEQFKHHAESPDADATTATTAPTEQHRDSHQHEVRHEHSHLHGDAPPAPAGATRRLLQESNAQADASHAHEHAHDHPAHQHEHEEEQQEAAPMNDSPSDTSADSDSLTDVPDPNSNAIAVDTVPPPSHTPIIVCFEETHGSRFMGMSLAIGFVFMILADRILGLRSPSRAVVHPPPNDIEQPAGSPHNNRHSIELKNRVGTASAVSSPNGAGLATPQPRHSPASTQPTPVPSPNTPHVPFPSQPSHAATLSRKFDPMVMLGFLLYAIVDGACLGAWSIDSQLVVNSELLLALLLHKAPMAFGVTSFLLYQGRTLASVRKQLLLYALAAPAACVAFSLLLGESDPLTLGDGSARGLAILFTGGCFLFTIAVHILPELQAQYSGAGPTKIAPDLPSATSASSQWRDAKGTLALSPGVRTTPNPRLDDHVPAMPMPASAVPSAVTTAALEDEAHAKTIPWRYVWAIVLGLLVPMACSYVQERRPLLA